MTTDTKTLEEALRETAMRQWQGKRCYATNMSQAKSAMDDLLRIIRPLGDQLRPLGLAEVGPEHVQEVTAKWYKQGLSPATINKRLGCLKSMGVDAGGFKNVPKVLKWWLKPSDEERLIEWLRGRMLFQMIDYIRWTTKTGLRVEETLALTWGMIDMPNRLVTVPGTKTEGAQATIVIGSEAHDVLTRRWEKETVWNADGSSAGWGRNRPERYADEKVFTWTYEKLNTVWQQCREFLGVQDVPTATLKALRRNAARYLHVTLGMPLDLVRQYLRHKNVETTMEYLRLTGGYSTEEMRRWIK